MKKKIKCILLSVFLVVLSVFALTGCKKNKENTIVFWHSMGKENQKVLDEIIKDFKKLYPNLDVEHEQKGGYNELLDAIKKGIPANNIPDMSLSYTDHVASYNGSINKPVVNLEPFIKGKNGFSDEEINDFVDSYWAEGQSYEDKGIYSLPFSKSSEVLFYNKTFFDEHKLQVPNSWQEAEAVAKLVKTILYEEIEKEINADKKIKPEDKAKKIKDAQNDVYPIGYDSSANLFISCAAQKNLPYTGFNNDTHEGEILFADAKTNEGIKDMILYFYNLYTARLFATKNELGGSYTSTKFIIKKMIMSIGSTAGLKYIEPKTNGKEYFEVGVAPVFSFKGDDKKVIQQGPNINMFDKGEKKNNKTWLFMKYLVSPEVSAKYAAETGYFPVRKSSFDTETYKNVIKQVDSKDPLEALKGKVASIFKEVSQAGFVSPAFDRSSAARNAVDKVFNNVFTLKDFGTLPIDKQKEKIQEILEKKQKEIMY